jgi:Flp pilus assembly pilin Flp
MRIASGLPATGNRPNWLERFADDTSGASMIEYGLILALVAVLAIASLEVLGTSAKTSLSSAASFLP